MAKFKFNGDYTGGRDSISILGHHFEGRKPTEVEDEEIAARFRRHPEFLEVGGKGKENKDKLPAKDAKDDKAEADEGGEVI